MTLYERLNNSPFIRASVQDNGLVTYNFTRQAFWGNNWDAQTITARGLFMDGDTIVGRGYRKFFNVDQPHGFTRQQIEDEFIAPVRVTTKRNGFLGIMFVYNDELLLWSKGGDTDYSRAAKRFLDSQARVNQDAIKKVLVDNNISLTWEIVLDNDPHVVSEPWFGMYLLDAIKNNESGDIVTDDILGEQYPIDMQCKQWGLDSVSDAGERNDGVVLGWESVKTGTQGYVNTAVDEGVMEFIDGLEDYTEGYVIRDAEGRMSKIKLDWYLELKRLRTPLNRALVGKGVGKYSIAEWLPEGIQLALAMEDFDEFRRRVEDCIVRNISGAEEISLPCLDRKFDLHRRYLDYLK